MSTGFEAVMGYLHMTEDIARLEELIAWCIDEVEKKSKKFMTEEQDFCYLKAIKIVTVSQSFNI